MSTNHCIHILELTAHENVLREYLFKIHCAKSWKAITNSINLLQLHSMYISWTSLHKAYFSRHRRASSTVTHVLSNSFKYIYLSCQINYFYRNTECSNVVLMGCSFLVSIVGRFAAHFHDQTPTNKSCVWTIFWSKAQLLVIILKSSLLPLSKNFNKIRKFQFGYKQYRRSILVMHAFNWWYSRWKVKEDVLPIIWNNSF